MALAGCGSPPQIVEISPQRGATDVPSDEPVRVRFDRPMDRATVAAAFRLEPAIRGSLRWTDARELLFEHVPFDAASLYRVVLDPGYRDTQGAASSLRHSWTFRTEQPPVLAGASPGHGERDVDPASYITLNFTRAMEPATLTSAISLSPAAEFSVRVDASDPRQVVIAPDSLLDPRVDYSVAVTRDARDVDGNPLGAGALVSFATGELRPLRHWVGFVAEAPSAAGRDGVWIVDESRFPRRLIGTPVDVFSWSPDGMRLLLRSPSGLWTVQSLGDSPAPLPIRGRWAAFLDPRQGYAFLDGGTLRVLRPDGQVVSVASGVREAAVAPGGRRLAFVVAGGSADASPSPAGDVIEAYDVDLRTRYRLQVEPAAIDGLAWSPDALSIAYRLDAVDPLRRQVRVRSLRDGATVTVATGEVAAPAWQAGSRYLFFTAIVGTPAGPAAKLFRAGVGDPPRTPSADQGMPAGPLQVDSFSPSPDGHQVAFVAQVSGRPSVWSMNADGTGLAQLTESDPARFPYSCRDVSWTPA